MRTAVAMVQAPQALTSADKSKVSLTDLRKLKGESPAKPFSVTCTPIFPRGQSINMDEDIHPVRGKAAHREAWMDTYLPDS